MNNLIELDLVRHQRALVDWLKDCKHRMNIKFPKIEFEADYWPIKTIYNTEQQNWNFTPTFDDFNTKDRSFCEVARGLMAEIVLKGKLKKVDVPNSAFRQLANAVATSIFEININDLRIVEDDILAHARKLPSSAGSLSSSLTYLKQQIDILSDIGVISQFRYHPRKNIKAELLQLKKHHQKKIKNDRSTTLDHKIEAFNDALNALFENDSRLSAEDSVAIAAATLLMCAPSRINEVLCCSIDDHVTIEDYVQKTSMDGTDKLHQAHQMLLIMMKGSKGSSWGAKPALNFMIDAFKYAWEVIKQHGQRSRMLVEWYQQHPSTLYLPPELEYLKGKDLNYNDLAKILYFTENPSETNCNNAKSYFHTPLKSLLPRNAKYLTDNSARGSKPAISIKYVDIEYALLQKVHGAMEDCRKTMKNNHYQGDLSKMLFLFDRVDKQPPYLPSAINYQIIHYRLKKKRDPANVNPEPSLFEKLGITMPDKGKTEYAWIDSHDPRRWLTTQALLHGEKLSDVLINKWANRIKLAQLKDYDLRTDEELASFSKMPTVHELTDITNGIKKVNKLQVEYGLKQEIVSVLDANISCTSLDMVLQAVEDRPIARTSEQIIILYPSQFGLCLHQHHETPCRNYDSCLPCNCNIVVKGHITTNDKIRQRCQLMHQSIIRQFDRLVTELDREIADDPKSVELHILDLVTKGLNCEQIADHLIGEFHEIKSGIKDKLFAKRLEEAFVARGFVKLLDDKEIPNGSLLKYNNPTYHASPGHEKALSSHGGREQIQRAEQALVKKFPQFAPKALNLKDERHLLIEDGENSKD